MTQIDAVFGRVLADARARAGLTQEALASRAKVHPTYVSQLERGLKSPTLRVLVELAAACGVEASAMLADLETRLEGEP